MKKKKKEKHKKSKKSKHKKYQSSDSSESEDEWEEAESSTAKKIAPPVESHSNRSSDGGPSFATKGCDNDTSKREDWMSSSLLGTVCNATSVRENKTKERKLEIKRKEEEKNLEIYNARELNPYRKTGQSESGRKEDEVKKIGDGGGNNWSRKGEVKKIGDGGNNWSRKGEVKKIGDGGSSWIHKSYERAKEQAKERNVPLEQVVKEKWGSMEKLEALLKSANRNTKSAHSLSERSGSGSGSAGWRKQHSESRSSEKSASGSKSTDVTETCDISINTTDKVENYHTDNRKESTGRSTQKESVPNKISTETTVLSAEEKNKLNARLLRAELMGDDDLIAELKRKLDGGGMVSDEGKSEKLDERKRKDHHSSSSGDEEIILTRSDKHGNLYPIKLTDDDDHKNAKRKKKIISTHESGQRMRYFEDDDKTDLKTMVEQEHLTSSDDQHAMLARLAGKHLGKRMGDDYTIDDMFVQASATKGEVKVENKRTKEKAIFEDKLRQKQLSSCRFCFENPNIAKHLIISIGTKVYISVPMNASLTENHCLIIPMSHVSAQTYLDEDVVQEVNMFKKCLTKMFADVDEDVMFIETCKNLRGRHHCVIECIPVPKEIGDMGPIYFKKAISETGSEWSDNKKVITIDSKKGVANALPKGLSYFAVEFGLDGGFGHIIEEESFPHYFGKEIIGGMMDLEPRLWLKPPNESFELHKRKVFKFTEAWKEYDWTSQVK